MYYARTFCTYPSLHFLVFGKPPPPPAHSSECILYRRYWLDCSKCWLLSTPYCSVCSICSAHQVCLSCSFTAKVRRKEGYSRSQSLLRGALLSGFAFPFFFFSIGWEQGTLRFWLHACSGDQLFFFFVLPTYYPLSPPLVFLSFSFFFAVFGMYSCMYCTCVAAVCTEYVSGLSG